MYDKYVKHTFCEAETWETRHRNTLGLGIKRIMIHIIKDFRRKIGVSI